jgi:hypothetical protein
MLGAETGNLNSALYHLCLSDMKYILSMCGQNVCMIIESWNIDHLSLNNYH